MVSNTNVFFVQDDYQVLNQFLKANNFSKIFLIVDENTNEYCLPHFLPKLETELAFEIIELEIGEEHKTIETCVGVWEALTELGCDRKSLIINVGGGVITDMGGFIASTFKRGISYINVPTTLLAMVDASVGGKNGVDLGGLKNQIGTITQAEMILIDSAYLQTLPQRELKSGLAEMLKHGLIADKAHWEKFKNLADINFDEFDDLIKESVAIKEKIVAEDPKENGIRKALNFGHTLGHAVETYFLENTEREKMLHGEAIACGMILESFISKEKGLLSNQEYVEIKNHLNNIYEKANFNELDIITIKSLLIHDKKNEFGIVHFSLLDKIGNCVVNQMVDDEIILKAFEDYKN